MHTDSRCTDDWEASDAARYSIVYIFHPNCYYFVCVCVGMCVDACAYVKYVNECLNSTEQYTG